MTTPTAQLYLITPTRIDASTFGRSLARLCDGGDVACVLFSSASTIADDVLVEAISAVQATGAAALLDSSSAQVTHVAADGLHVADPAGLPEAVRRLKPAGIVGAGGLVSRDDAMTAGESGIDYVMLGEAETDPFEDRLERVAWWAEIFQVPCVAVAHSLGEVAPLAETGAEFIGLGAFVWGDPAGPEAAMAAVRRAVADGHAAYLARLDEQAAS